MLQKLRIEYPFQIVLIAQCVCVCLLDMLFAIFYFSEKLSLLIGLVRFLGEGNGASYLAKHVKQPPPTK